MIRTKLAGVSAAGVGAATAVAALLLGSTTGSATEASNSAYGVYLGVAGEDVIDREPSVVFEGGESVGAELADTPADSPLRLRVLAVDASAEGSSAQALGVGLLEDTGMLEGLEGLEGPLDDVDLGPLTGGTETTEGLLSLDVLTTTCVDGVGSVEIVNGTLGGEELPGQPELNEQLAEGLDLGPLLQLTLNRQTENPDGTLTVDGLVLEVLPPNVNGELPIGDDDLPVLEDLLPEDTEVPGLDGQELPLQEVLNRIEDANPELGELGDEPLLELVLTSATCGPNGDDNDDDNGGDDDGTPSAPKPEPIETNLPVTH